MKIDKYENLMTKVVYANKGSFNDGSFREIQLHKGLRLLITDGYKFIYDRQCKSIYEAIRAFKELYNKGE